jgi:hypothetical protein
MPEIIEVIKVRIGEGLKGISILIKHAMILFTIFLAQGWRFHLV